MAGKTERVRNIVVSRQSCQNKIIVVCYGYNDFKNIRILSNKSVIKVL